MSCKRKISVVILGREEALKKAVITIILGKELSKLSNGRASRKHEIYENDTCEVVFTPDLYIQYKDIQDLFFYHQYPDLCLLVVEDGFSPEDVWKQIDHLSNKTGKPTETFTVLLPLRSKPTDYAFKSSTMPQVFSELEKLAEGKNPVLTNTRYTDKPLLRLSAPRPERPVSGTPHTERPVSATPHTERPVSGSELYFHTRKFTSTTVNLVLLGMAGNGKSASGNTILGKPVFFSRPSSKQVTTECNMAETEIKGVHVRVIDTPDIFDDHIGKIVKNTHLKRCKELCESHPCVYVLVMHINRFTDGERDILKKLEKAFGSKVKERTVILFTKADDLLRAGKTLDEFLHSCQPNLKEIIQKVGNRCVLFENSRSSSTQVKKLMDTMFMLLEK